MSGERAPERASLRTIEQRAEIDLRSPGSLREYAFLGDGERGCLVGHHGDVAWMCFPGYADPAVFAGLLGSGGLYRIVVEDRAVSGGYYEDGTLIWHGRWVHARGVVESTEALAYPGREDRAVFLRRLEATDAIAQVTVLLELGVDYGRVGAGPWRRRGRDFVAEADTFVARWSGAEEAVVVRNRGGRRLALRLELRPGERRDLVLELSTRPFEGPPGDPMELWQATERAWRDTVPSLEGVAARDDARRAFAILRGMTSKSGGTVAAATTSLPERRDTGRDYDYRYAWIRDTCYLGHAGAAVLGGEAMLDDAVRFVAARLNEDGPKTLPAYVVDGRPIPPTTPLDVPGYPGGPDVVGNQVNEQFQLDLFGEALLLFAEAARSDRLDAAGWTAAEAAIAAIEQRANEPESGIWELEPRTWTHSRLICVAGLRAMAAAAPLQGLAARLLPLADHLLDETTRNSLHPSGRWRRTPDDDRVDASLLLAEVRHAVPPGDPRSVSTREAVQRELTVDGYVYRYSHGDRLGQAEGAFLVCNFWMALASLEGGSATDAVAWFERARTSCGSPGLFSEEFDVEERQLRGNLPQAFVHALLLETGARLGAGR